VGLPDDKRLGEGTVGQEVASATGDDVVARGAADRRRVATQIIITSSCEFKQVPRDIAFDEMRAMRTANALPAGKR
jgi:hypothetical protein